MSSANIADEQSVVLQGRVYQLGSERLPLVDILSLGMGSAMCRELYMLVRAREACGQYYSTEVLRSRNQSTQHRAIRFGQSL